VALSKDEKVNIVRDVKEVDFINKKSR